MGPHNCHFPLAPRRLREMHLCQEIATTARSSTADPESAQHISALILHFRLDSNKSLCCFCLGSFCAQPPSLNARLSYRRCMVRSCALPTADVRRRRIVPCYPHQAVCISAAAVLLFALQLHSAVVDAQPASFDGQLRCCNAGPLTSCTSPAPPPVLIALDEVKPYRHI
jgi:hypothetical protein